MTAENATPSPATFGLRTGSVEAFDAEEGLGLVVDSVGTSWQFHCTAIADGSRRIAVGAAVSFDVAPGGPGRWEAFRVTPSGLAASSA